MANRKPISKKMRFEVFKRDKFTCQYCGRMSPDVILEVDHIKPVAEGGTNDLINLVTSCKDCNRGKGKIELSDTSAVKVQQNQLKDLSKKSEQLEMLVRWKDELLAADDKKVGIVCDYIESTYGGHVVDSGKAKIRVYLKQYSVEEVISAFDEAYLRTRGDYRFTLDLLPKCAYYARHPIAPDVQQILYLRKILFNRLKFVNARQAYALIEQALYERGISFDDIKHLCCSCTNWTDFKTQIGELTKDG